MPKFTFSFKKVFLITLIILIASYGIMFLTTNSVMRYAKSVFHGEISVEDVIDTPLYRYYPKDPAIVKVNVNLKRLFVIHGFKDGYIWVKYDEAQLDYAGYEVSGSRDAIARWKIHKENGEWKVVDIKEAP